MMNQEIFHIADLISKYIHDKLSSEERKELETWVNSSPEHQKMLDRFSHYSFLEEKITAEQQAHREKACKQYRVRLQADVHRKQIRRWWYGSAAALALALITIAGILLYPSPQIESVVVAQQYPTAGESRAVLTLSNGCKINLEKHTTTDPLLNKEFVLDTLTGCIEYKYSDGGGEETRYNQIDIPRKGEYRVILADGTRVWLNSESQLRYPVAFNGNERRVCLKGEAYFEVKRDERMPFIVEVGESAVQVLGTSFNIRNYADEKCIYTTLVEGSVRLSCGQESEVLLPNEQGIIEQAEGRISKRQVVTSLYTSWKDGRFIFENQTLVEIMQTLSRWYDVNVFYANEQVKEAMFNGNLKRYEDFNNVIEMLELTGVAHFKVNGNTIIVSE